MTDARGRRAERVRLAVAFAAPTLPLVVALVVRHHPPWVPDLDLALTELRVRDVGGADTPLIGLPGRFGTFDRQGSHPGPLGYYLLAGPYRLLGGSAFALQVATVLLHLAGLWTAVALVARRAGTRWALGCALALTALITALGPNLFTEPWNPHLPVAWWPAFLVAVWIALTGDARVLPVVVGAGALCAQTHISYLGPVGALTIAAFVAAVARPNRPDRASVRWALGAVALGLLLWAPPVVDQVRGDPGNAGVVIEHLRHADDPPVGLRAGGRLVLEHLDLWHLGRALVADPGHLSGSYPDGAAAWRGAVLLLGWGAVAAIGLRRGSRSVRALHGLAGAGLVLALVSAVRILGYPWGYLLLWVWSVALLMVLAAVATVAPRAGERTARAAPLLLGGLALLLIGRAAVAGGHAEEAFPVLSRTVTAVVPTVADELDPDQRYLVRWSDSLNIGGHGYGLFDELERRGFDVAVPPGLATQFGAHRAAADDAVDGQVVIATGLAIEGWAEVPGVRELVRVDVRTEAEAAEAVRVRTDLLAALAAQGLDDLVPIVDVNLYGVAFDPRLDRPTQRLVARLGELGAPAAVFLTPVGAELP